MSLEPNGGVLESASLANRQGVPIFADTLQRYIAFVFGSLVGSTLLSAILVAPALLVHFLWFKPHPTEHRRYVKDNLEAWLFWLAANLTISWYLALCVDVFPILLRFLISAFWGHVSETVKTRIELYNSVKDTIKPVFYAASGWVSWIIVFANISHLRDMDDPSKSRAQYTVRVSILPREPRFPCSRICSYTK